MPGMRRRQNNPQTAVGATQWAANYAVDMRVAPAGPRRNRLRTI